MEVEEEEKEEEKKKKNKAVVLGYDPPPPPPFTRSLDCILSIFSNNEHGKNFFI
jgi:hypothetical protein